MPAIYHYVVTETHRVEVSAPDESTALERAETHFKGGDPNPGAERKLIERLELNIRKV